MITTIYSIVFIYIFIFLGYLAKRIFKRDINTKTLTIISVYFLQPFVTMWGFSTTKLYTQHLDATYIYLIVVISILIPTVMLSKLLFKDVREKAIFSIAGFVGNTGNIGIPIGIALFGEQSVIYTTLINICNVFIVYTIGTYIYSRGSFNIGKSLLNIIKIPIIPFSILAIFINIYNIPISKEILGFLKMGAYAGIVMQLFLFGTFLYGIGLNKLNPKLLIGTLSIKFILLPIATVFVFSLFPHVHLYAQGVILMEMFMPLAIANINLASLYGCKPKDVTSLILVSTIIVIPIIFLFSFAWKYYLEAITIMDSSMLDIFFKYVL